MFKAFQLISSIMKAVERANDAVDELQQADSFRSNFPGQINLKACPGKTQQEIDDREHQGGIKNWQLFSQNDPPLSTVYGDKRGIELMD